LVLSGFISVFKLKWTRKNGNMRGRTELLPVPCAFLDLNVLLVKDVCLRVLVHLHKREHIGK